METDIINTLFDYDRVTSTYADIYFDDEYCERNLISEELLIKNDPQSYDDIETTDDWVSPSDHLIGKIELNPPFTSKITRGKTHEGILAIGNEVLEKEHKRFTASLTSLLHENDDAWNYILVNEKKDIAKSVKEIFQNIFEQKSQIMYEEIAKFYEITLQDLEGHFQSEVQTVLTSVHASMISFLNTEIPLKLKKERNILEDVLKKKFKTEVDKIVKYYKLLLDNELHRSKRLINYVLNERNDAVQAFCRQISAERLTTSMYIMSMERKKCKIKKMFLENYQTTELTEKLEKIKERQEIIETYKRNEFHISEINKQWEEKIKKVVELFLKFISFSMKLLPEQSSFLLDFQKMVILQLNEIQNQPNLATSILIDEDRLANVIEFEKSADEKNVCELKPFVLIGDLSDPSPTHYGSTETLPSDVDLPLIRVNRHYLYAKCHGYEGIKQLLKSQQCQCHQSPSPINSQVSSPAVELPQPSTSTKSSSSTELALFDDFHRFEECPARSCHVDRTSLFPFMPSYLDFNEQNFERVKAILGKTYNIGKLPELNVKNIAESELPFAETKEKYHTVETQYSDQELDPHDLQCICIDEHKSKANMYNEARETNNQPIYNALTKRKISLQRLLENTPNLLSMLTDESFDFHL